jgi:hypothetical protein
MKIFGSLLGLLAFSVIAPELCGQTLVSSQIITAGGVSYLQTEISGLGCCRALNTKTPISRVDNVLYVSVQAVTEVGCVSIPECELVTVRNTFVLGTLEPGDYDVRLWIYDYFGEPFTFPIMLQFSSSVSNATENGRSLTISSGSGTNGLTCQVNGVDSVRYVVETSADLTNWTAVRTNIGAPFNFTISSQSAETNRYYRTKIFSSR